MDSFSVNLDLNLSGPPLPMSLKLREMTGLAFFSGSSGLSSDILKPSNHWLPAYLSLKYASIMLRFRDFPNLLGRVNRKTAVPLFDRTKSISGVLST